MWLSKQFQPTSWHLFSILSCISGRVSRAYPRDIVEGTPDDVRAKKFRQKRDIGVAMKLEIGDGDDDSNNGTRDSVFSGSTNVTEEEEEEEESNKDSDSEIGESVTSEYISDRVRRRGENAI